ncbi:MAG: transporter substrate-binding domain-containing protein [Oscillospiraceae bacterium]|nr:transporter substrate-binding domain-containing protein [Oscillospiraceae bacterium]MCL2278564.1 transporter substrate-binding domain-containing protein [Oscillospiraceae bacterium]
MNKLIIKAYIFPLAFVLLFTLTGCAGGIPNDVHTPEDVANRTIGVLSGTPAVRLADDVGTAVSFDVPEAMLSALIAGHIDCIIMEGTTAEALIAGTSGARILQDPILEYELRIAVPRENTRLLDAINAALEELDNNGILRNLYNKYFARGRFEYEPPASAGTRPGNLVVALPPDSPPLSFMGDDGRFVGMDVEVAIAVADILGVSLGVLEHDAVDLISSILHGRADFAMGWPHGDAEDFVHTSEPYAIVRLVVIVRR